jgi:hypothetical protein
MLRRATDGVWGLPVREQPDEVPVEPDFAAHQVEPGNLPRASPGSFGKDPDALLAKGDDVRLPAQLDLATERLPELRSHDRAYRVGVSSAVGVLTISCPKQKPKYDERCGFSGEATALR